MTWQRLVSVDPAGGTRWTEIGGGVFLTHPLAQLVLQHGTRVYVELRACNYLGLCSEFVRGMACVCVSVSLHPQMGSASRRSVRHAYTREHVR